MNKKIFMKILSYILSVFLLVITLINHIYRINGKTFLLKPSIVGVFCVVYYLFLDNKTKDNLEFDKTKKVLLLSVVLYSLFEVIVLIVG